MAVTEKKFSGIALERPIERLVEGELRIAGAFTWKLCNLLSAIESTGSLKPIRFLRPM